MKELSRNPKHNAARFAFAGLERVLHEKARLGIMTSLAANPSGLLFNDLKALCGLTDGNLNRHLKVLQEAGLVEVWKRVAGRRQQTLCRVTAAGRERFVDYIGALERVIHEASAAAGTPHRHVSGQPWAQGWSPA